MGVFATFSYSVEYTLVYMVILKVNDEANKSLLPIPMIASRYVAE